MARPAFPVHQPDDCAVLDRDRYRSRARSAARSAATVVTIASEGVVI
jgi:hypothetical protein